MPSFTYRNIIDSNILGATTEAIVRRIAVSKVLFEKGMLGIAEIIDALKEKARYAHLNKRSHITLIKNDIEHLKAMKLVFENDNKYFVIADVLS